MDVITNPVYNKQHGIQLSHNSLRRIFVYCRSSKCISRVRTERGSYFLLQSNSQLELVSCTSKDWFSTALKFTNLKSLSMLNCRVTEEIMLQFSKLKVCSIPIFTLKFSKLENLVIDRCLKLTGKFIEKLPLSLVHLELRRMDFGSSLHSVSSKKYPTYINN